VFAVVSCPAGKKMSTFERNSVSDIDRPVDGSSARKSSVRRSEHPSPAGNDTSRARRRAMNSSMMSSKYAMVRRSRLRPGRGTDCGTPSRSSAPMRPITAK
jgi:hypothetical protein